MAEYICIGGKADNQTIHHNLARGITKLVEGYTYIAIQFKDDEGTPQTIFIPTGTAPADGVKTWKQRRTAAKA